MTQTITRPQWAARAVTIALWGVGSAYLVKTELASQTPDPVVLASTPVVWAVVIALPILATYARRDGQWMAMALIWLAAIVGSAYTLQATIGRQAASRDVAVASAADMVRQRDAVQRDLDATKANLEAARQRCGTGRTCHESTRQLVAMYERQEAAHTAKLDALKLPAPAAGERRIAWLLTLATGKDAATVAEVVGLFLPALFGLTLELAAFACAMYGWHPCRQPLPPVVYGPTGGNRAENVIAFPAKQHPVVEALAKVGRPVSNGELARLMGVSDGEATKRRREVERLLREHRTGRHVMVALA